MIYWTKCCLKYPRYLFKLFIASAKFVVGGYIFTSVCLPVPNITEEVLNGF